MGLRCGALEGRSQGWDCEAGGLMELPGTAGMCLPHAPPQLPEQDLARTSKETEGLNLQVQKSNLILQVKNLDLQSKIFCSACVGGFLFSPEGFSFLIKPMKCNIPVGPHCSLPVLKGGL